MIAGAGITPFVFSLRLHLREVDDVPGEGVLALSLLRYSDPAPAEVLRQARRLVEQVEGDLPGVLEVLDNIRDSVAAQHGSPVHNLEVKVRCQRVSRIAEERKLVAL